MLRGMMNDRSVSRNDHGTAGDPAERESQREGKRVGLGLELLASPTRRMIVGALAERPARASVLARRVGMSLPALSRQLRLLREADLIEVHDVAGDGRMRLYSVSPRRHGRITAWLVGTGIGIRPDSETMPWARIRDDLDEP